MSIPFRILSIDRANGIVSVEYELPGGDSRINNIHALTRPARLQTIDSENGAVLKDEEHSIPVDLDDPSQVLAGLRAWGERYYGMRAQEEPLASIIGQRQE